MKIFHLIDTDSETTVAAETTCEAALAFLDIFPGDVIPGAEAWSEIVTAGEEHCDGISGLLEGYRVDVEDSGKIEIEENFCVGGDVDPYIVPESEAAEIILGFIRASEHREDAEGVPAVWSEVAKLGALVAGGEWLKFDVTASGALPSSVSARTTDETVQARTDAIFAESPDMLEQMAEEALAARRRGETRPLNLDEL